MNERVLEFSKRIELLGRTSVVLLGVIYGTGFTIVSLHQAKFGISAFELLRPRVFAAGFSFVAVVALVCLAAFRILSAGPWQETGPFYTRIRNTSAARLIAAPFLLLACQTILVSGNPLFISPDLPPEPWDWRGAFYIGSIVLITSIPFVGMRLFSSRPTVAFVLSVVAIIANGLGTWWVQGSESFWILAWVFGTGILATLLYDLAHVPDRLNFGLHWETIAIMLVVVLTWYVAAVYPHVKTAFGGGAPVSVRVHFSNGGSFSRQVLDTKLIEENAHGFYVSTMGGPIQAYFIRRDMVEFIEFQYGESGQWASFPP